MVHEAKTNVELRLQRPVRRAPQQPSQLSQEAPQQAQQAPYQAEDIGGVSRSSIQTIQRALNNLTSKNQEISASLAAFSLLGFPSTMTSRKFWYIFIRPAVADMKRWFPHESANVQAAADSDSDADDGEAPDADADADGAGRPPRLVDDSDSDDDEEEKEEAKDDESASGSDVADHNGGAAEPSNSADRRRSGTAGDDGDEKMGDVAPSVEHENHVIDFSGADNDDVPDTDGTAEVTHHREGGAIVLVQQHTHYKYRSAPLREFNFDEYGILVKVCRVREQPAAAADGDEDEDGDDGDGDEDGGDDGDDGDDEDATIAPAAARAAAPAARRTGARTRNGRFNFARDHPLFLSHEQQLRSDPRIGILAGKAAPPYPGPRQDTPSWRRSAQIFAEYMVTLLCSWNPVTFHPERFDRNTQQWVDVPLNWDGMSEWVEDLYNREAELRRRAGSADVCVRNSLETFVMIG